MQSNSYFCLFPRLGLRFPLALRPSSVGPAYGARQRSPASFRQQPQAPPARAAQQPLFWATPPPQRLPFRPWLAQPSSRSCPPAPPHASACACARPTGARPRSTFLKGVARIVLLSSELRGFAPSRDTSDLARSLDWREEAMIADLKHYPVMKHSHKTKAEQVRNTFGTTHRKG